MFIISINSLLLFSIIINLLLRFGRRWHVLLLVSIIINLLLLCLSSLLIYYCHYYCYVNFYYFSAWSSRFSSVGCEKCVCEFPVWVRVGDLTGPAGQILACAHWHHGQGGQWRDQVSEPRQEFTSLSSSAWNGQSNAPLIASEILAWVL